MLLLLSGCSVLRWQDAVSSPGAVETSEELVAPWRQGVWRIQREWSPLANLQAARRSGLTWSRERWMHPAAAEWDRKALGGTSRARSPQTESEQVSGHTAARTWETASADVISRIETLPADVRVHVAIWLVEQDSRLSRAAADLGPVVITGRLRNGHLPWESLGNLSFSKERSRAAASEPTEVVAEATRLAAARAWCFQLAGDDSQTTDVETRLQPVGQRLQARDLPASIQLELIRTLGQWLPPSRIPQLAESMAWDDGPVNSNSAAASPRLAALESGLAWLVQRRNSQREPDEQEESDQAWWLDILQRNERPEVGLERFLYDANLTLLGDNATPAILAAELSTLDWGERERTAVLIGLSQGPVGAEALGQLLRQAEDGPRLLALRGLATRDDFLPETFAEMSPRLRTALAECLGEQAPAKSVTLAGRLIVDIHPQVADAMLQALEKWPADDALPVLLTALTEGSYKTRRDAYRLLQSHRGTFEFPINADVRERREAILGLRDKWAVAKRDPVDTPQSQRKPLALDPERERAVLSLLERRSEWANTEPEGPGSDDADSVWSRFTAKDLPYLERLLESGPEELRLFLGDVLLPRLSPTYAAFRDLRSPQVATRRSAATTLREAARNRSLPAPILSRLAGVLRDEQDQEVWRAAFLAVENEAADDAAILARTAAETHWPDLRLLALDYAARHRRRDAGQWVLPLLSEKQPRVQQEAVRVAGLLGDPALLEGTRDGEGGVIYPGLRSMLPGATGQLRWSVVLALAQLGDGAGLDELNRLARDTEPLTRAAAVRAMGETRQSRFVQPLLEMLWTETSPTVQAAGLTALGQLVPEDRHPPRDTSSAYSERLQAWADAAKSL